MNDLAAFLNARLDEREAAAKAAARQSGKDWDAASQGSGRERDGVLWDEDHANVIAWFDSEIEAATHAARHDPRRVLREVEADRAMLAEYGRLQASYGGRARDDRLALSIWYRVLVFRAAVYRDHPDYDEAWR